MMIVHAAILWLVMATGGLAPSAPLPATPAQVEPASPASTGPSRLYTPNHPDGLAGDGPRGAPARARGIESGALADDPRDPDAPATGSADSGAQTPRQIVESSRLSPAAALALIVVSLLITAGVLWSAFWWWRVKTEPPCDTAMRILGRRWRLSAGQRDAIVRAARARGVPPVGLLVSPSALIATLRASGGMPPGD